MIVSRNDYRVYIGEAYSKKNMHHCQAGGQAEKVEEGRRGHDSHRDLGCKRAVVTDTATARLLAVLRPPPLRLRVP